MARTADREAKCTACHHKQSAHHARTQDGEDVPFPDYWENAGGQFNKLIELNAASINEFQALFNKTHLGKWTRDRTKHNPTNPKVPTGFQVVSVRRSENSHCWREYGCRRAEVILRAHEAEGEALRLYDDVKSMTAWREVAGAKADRVARECNEWYLFHGTHHETAKKIMETDFRVGCAGSNTGSLYGKGLYFAESVTKADEYAKADTNGLFTMLVCRVIGGQVRYTDELEPDPEDLVQSCISGKYDCVLGDRETTRGTYREFVLFDSQDVYAEYEVQYRRVYS